MRRAVTTLIALIVGIAGIVSVAWAQSGAPTQPTGPAPPPNGPPAPKSGPSLIGGIDYPSDFHVHTGLWGYGFKPGEAVTVSASTKGFTPIQTTADGNGSFVVTADYTWVFCGPNGAAAPSPAFHAAGDMGSSADLPSVTAPCPELEARQHLDVQPGSGNGTGAAGTVVVGTAVAVPGGPISSTTQVPVTPVPRPTAVPILLTFDVRAFGFAPGERVTLRELSSPATTPPPIRAVADAQGRFTASMTAWVPGLCAPSHGQQVSATGDKGTALAAPFSWLMPLIACPASGPDTPGVPNPPPPSDAATVVVPSLALAVRPASVHPGGTIRVTVRTDGSAPVSLAIRYPDGRTAHRTLKLKAGGVARIRLTVPRGADKGAARIRATVDGSNLSVTSTFTVR